jgi:aryl-alcohol dehydrogenase-like predicted oxidoreductase
MLKKRPLGKTGLQVTELSLGALWVASFASSFEQGRQAVLRAVELGVNYIDTAPGYGDSEKVVGQILPEISQPLILSTKLGGRPHPFEPQNPKHLLQSFEESLKLLKRDRIDILMIHEPERPGQYEWWTDRDAVTGPVLEVLDQLKKQGAIRFTGIGGTTAYEMVPLIKSGKFDVVLTAFNYSLLWREAEYDLLPAAIEQGMGIVIGSPLQQGALAVRRDEEVERGAKWMSKPRRDQYKALYKLLDETGMGIAEMGLRFILSNPNISCMLMGARSMQEVDMNVQAVEKGPLAPDLIARIDAIARKVPFQPREEPFVLPFVGQRQGPWLAR